MVITFVYEHNFHWEDGLYEALRLLSKYHHIKFINLAKEEYVKDDNITLGWGALGSRVDKTIRNLDNKKGLLIGGMSQGDLSCYDVVFYETEWHGQFINHKNKIHAFGVNTRIYKEMILPKIYDYITVGSFSDWKRQKLLLKKNGKKIAIGEVQKHNLDESIDIVFDLVVGGVTVSDMLPPQNLAQFYNMSEVCYIPSTVFGGGERAVLEARACGIEVEVEKDNPKLMSLLKCQLYDEEYYMFKLLQGISTLIT